MNLKLKLVSLLNYNSHLKKFIYNYLNIKNFLNKYNMKILVLKFLKIIINKIMFEKLNLINIQLIMKLKMELMLKNINFIGLINLFQKLII